MAEWDVVSHEPAPSFDDRWKPVSTEPVAADPWKVAKTEPVAAAPEAGLSTLDHIRGILGQFGSAGLPPGPKKEATDTGRAAVPGMLRDVLRDTLFGIAAIPERAIKGSQQDVQNMGSGEPMASVAPAADASMVMVPMRRTVGGVRAHPSDVVAPKVEPVAPVAPTAEWKPVKTEPLPAAAKPDFSLEPTQAAEPGQSFYNIVDKDGRIRGGVYTTIKDGKATIDNIEMAHGVDSLGPAAVRGLLKEYRALHPEVTELTGERISGARQGGQTAKEGPEVTVKLKTMNADATPPKVESISEPLAHPEPTPQQMNSAKSAARVVKNILSPDTVSPAAEGAAADIRSAGGRAARDTETTRSALEGEQRKVSALPDNEKLALIDYIENRSKGFEVPDKTLQPVADAIRTAMDARKAKIEKLDSTQKAHFVQDYYTHLWKDPEAAQAAFSGPAKEGTGRFLKERTVPTVADGLKRGLEPVSIDPIETTMRYVQNMDRFIATNEVIDKGLRDGMIKHFTPGEQPVGWVEVNSRRGAANPIFAPADWARVYNNFVDRGIHRNADWGRVYDSVRNTSNAITSLELGLSGFHGATMVQEAMVNAVAKGIGELAAGKPISAAKSILKAPVSPVTDLLRGRQLEHTYIGKSKGTPLMQDITNLLTEAGGRAKGAKHAPDYQYTQAGSYWDSFKRGSVLAELKQAGTDIKARPIAAPIKLMAQQVGRVMQTVAKPLFEYAIPKLKNGAFYENMASWMEANPKAPHAEQVKAARKIWDSIDNRFGETVQDNIFWNKTLKQSMQVALRSYSWTFGTIQEIGGGAAQLARHPTSLSPKSKHYSPKAAYVIALPIVYASLNAVYQKLKTGDNPESIQDVMRGGMTGGLVPGAGGKGEVLERAMMPGYMKDVFGWYHHPVQELRNKTATGPRMVFESFTNKDWKNQPIRNENDPTLDQVRQYFKYVYQSLGPISVKAMLKGQKEGSNISAPETLLGIHSMPTWLQDPEGSTKMMQGMNQRDWQKKERFDKRQEKQYGGPQ